MSNPIKKYTAVTRLVEMPDKIIPGEIVVLCADETGREPWSAHLLCPCGCGDVVSLPLVGSGPRWEIVELRENKFTIVPSVSRIVGCKSHFFIRKSEVVWA